MDQTNSHAMAHTATASAHTDMVWSNHHYLAALDDEGRLKKSEDDMASNHKSMTDHEQAAKTYSRQADRSHLSEAERAEAKRLSDEHKALAKRHEVEYDRLSKNIAHHHYNMKANLDEARFYDQLSKTNRVRAWFKSPPKRGKAPPYISGPRVSLAGT